MKAKDITVGGEYLVNSHNDWLTQMFTASSWGNRRVRVLDTTSQPWIYNDKTKAYEKGGMYSYRSRKGILAMVVDPDTGEDRGQTVVTLASVRGPWKEFFEKVTAACEAKQKVENLAKAAKGVRQGVVKGVLALAEKLGVKARCDRYDDDGNIVVAPAVFMEMLSALEAAGWKAEQK